MKKIIIATAAILLMTGACNSSSTKSEQVKATESVETNSADTAQQFNLDTTKLKTGEVFYQCPMHPEEISDKPDTCPKCGMDLEKTEKK